MSVTITLSVCNTPVHSDSLSVPLYGCDVIKFTIRGFTRNYVISETCYCNLTNSYGKVSKLNEYKNFFLYNRLTTEQKD